MIRILAATMLLAACTDPHFCASDGECKGNRICVRSVCEDPPGTSYDLRPDFTGNACGCINVNDCIGTKVPTDCFDGICRPYHYTCYLRDAGPAPDGDSCPADGVHYDVREASDGACER